MTSEWVELAQDFVLAALIETSSSTGSQLASLQVYCIWNYKLYGRNILYLYLGGARIETWCRCRLLSDTYSTTQ
jgi:hypothetical protein